MKVKMILGTIAASAVLAAVSSAFAAGDEDILVGGRTTYDGIRYDPEANLLTIVGGRGDDRIEVALAEDGGILVNGISMSKLGIRIPGVPVVAVYGGGGNDILIARRLPVAVMNGGDGNDMLVWDNSDGEFNRATYGEDLVVWNASSTERAFGGAGLDVLIGNTGGDRDECCGGLGQDDLVGGNTGSGPSSSRIGDLGNDWLVGGTGRDFADGGFGDDLLSADDVIVVTRAAAGDDIVGGWGNDWISGGTGRDN
jgi:Ca2+-binding RTX toxin-like protein